MKQRVTQQGPRKLSSAPGNHRTYLGAAATRFTRKQFLVGAVAGGAVASLSRPAIAAKRYQIKCGIDQTPDDPTTLHLITTAKIIKAATNGAVDMHVFPNNQLGNDTHSLSEVRSGAIQMMGLGDNVLASLVPSAAIDNIGFAFQKAETAWSALDGEVGDIVRAHIEEAGLHPMHAVWDEGFREITSSTHPIKTPESLAHFKIRVPESPISFSLFRDLGASPTALNSDEIFTALQTRVVDGQENPLSIIETQNFYQVQKYCSLTNHMWSGFWMIMNKAFWNRLPMEYQKSVAAAFQIQAAKQRPVNEALNNSLASKLASQGMSFNSPSPVPFREELAKAGFYDQWREKLGAKLWLALEKYTGKLG